MRDERVYAVQMPRIKDVAQDAIRNFAEGVDWPDSCIVREVRMRDKKDVVADGEPHMFSYGERLYEISLTDWRRVR